MSGYVAARRINHDGVTYQAGDSVPINAAQFADLEPSGCVKRAPRPKPAKQAEA